MKLSKNKKAKKSYPLIPYLIGLFITVVVVVLLSYLVQLRNKQELSTFYAPPSCIIENINIES